MPEGVSQYSVRRHPFTTAAIFTLQAPDRMLNPYDLRVYRARWQALVHNCSITSTTAYGLGQRLDRATFPSVSHADLRGDERSAQPLEPTSSSTKRKTGRSGNEIKKSSSGMPTN